MQEEKITRYAPTTRAPEDMVDGYPVKLGGLTYIVPALTLGQLKRLAPEIKRVSEQGAADGLDSLSVFDTAVPIVGQAMRRNYPDLTDEKVYELLDLATFPAVFDAVLGANGVLKGEILAQVAAPK